jgi:hypothetical protein
VEKQLREKSVKAVEEKYHALKGCLNEKARRIWAATEARDYGWGGSSVVHLATGIDYKTIQKGLLELAQPNQEEQSIQRIREKGGGRKGVQELQPTLVKDLEKLIDPYTRGNPESPLRWTCKSTYKLASALKMQGHTACQRTVYGLLRHLEYRLQANRKSDEGGGKAPDRNAQFEHIYRSVIAFQTRRCPTLSVDTKKKELVGNYKNNGQEYRKKKDPRKVKAYDFIDKNLGKVAPYGVYDIGKNKGWVSVGISFDTAAFAVNTIRCWWYQMGQSTYEAATDILITADCGGSNGYRTKLWKVELQKLANEIKKTIHVCHFPPGTSKWNKIEHRMFSYISRNWQGRPLITRETVVNLIANTTTEKGLAIQAMLDENIYEKGIKISKKEIAKIQLIPDDFHGEWNYKIVPLVVA